MAKQCAITLPSVTVMVKPIIKSTQVDSELKSPMTPKIVKNFLKLTYATYLSAWSHHNQRIAEFRDTFISSLQHSLISCSPELSRHFIPVHSAKHIKIKWSRWSSSFYNKEIELNEAFFLITPQLGLMFSGRRVTWNCPGQGIPGIIFDILQNI